MPGSGTSRHLNVPLVGQQHGYDGRPLQQPDLRGRLKPHGHMACWYASATMVSYYFRLGPRLGLPMVWQADEGLTVNSISRLAAAEGLKALPRPLAGITAEWLAGHLKNDGPIWAAVRVILDGYTGGHAIVLTGVHGAAVSYNDPWEPSRKTNAVSWLDFVLFRLPNAMLVKDRSRS